VFDDLQSLDGKTIVMIAQTLKRDAASAFDFGVFS
jgi:hypothetical protein